MNLCDVDLGQMETNGKMVCLSMDTKSPPGCQPASQPGHLSDNQRDDGINVVGYPLK